MLNFTNETLSTRITIIIIKMQVNQLVSSNWNLKLNEGFSHIINIKKIILYWNYLTNKLVSWWKFFFSSMKEKKIKLNPTQTMMGINIIYGADRATNL